MKCGTAQKNCQEINDMTYLTKFLTDEKLEVMHI